MKKIINKIEVDKAENGWIINVAFRLAEDRDHSSTQTGRETFVAQTDNRLFTIFKMLRQEYL